MGRRTIVRGAFGSEYAWRPSWRFWERLYVRVFGFVDLPSRLRARIILPEALALHPRRILDFGCGTGCYSFFLSRDKEVRVFAVDVDSNRIRESHSIVKRLQRKNLVFLSENQNAPLSHLPAGSFDLALAIEVLSCVPHIQKSLQEICRVLKPGGYLLGHIHMLRYLRPHEVNLFNDEVILKLLEGTGFGNIQVTPTFHGMTRKICDFYEKVSHSKLFVTFLFPWLLLVSMCLELKGTPGDYRFFRAQKRKGKDDRHSA